MYNQTVTVNTASNTVADDGSYSTTYSSTSGVVCSIQPMSSSESVQYERQASGEFARMYCSPSVSITAESEVVDAASVTWRVAGRPRDTAGKGMMQTIDLERLK
jgi:hypothetical protein